MNFFEEQSKARASTAKLILLFLLAVISIILVLDTLLIFFVKFDYIMGNRCYYVSAPAGCSSLWTYLFSPLSYYCSLFIFVMMMVTSLFKIYLLSKRGGSYVAKIMGGREIRRNTKDLLEKRYINIIEEMSIASGTPIPKIYVLDNEDSINAFVAGHDIYDAAIAVSKGCLDSLSREEFQGVVAHEFGHLFNGDMKLNIRIMGMVFGIVAFTVIGKVLVHTRGHGRHVGGVVLAGGILYIIGSIGVFFANIIKSAISRKREFLADASAVQYTRNPDGIVGAFKKILAGEKLSFINNPRAAEVSHFLFSKLDSTISFQIAATHPPLELRIKAIDKTFNKNNFFKNEVKKIREKLYSQRECVKDNRCDEHKSIKDEGASFIPMIGATVVASSSLMNSIGNPKKEHLEYAQKILTAIPKELRDGIDQIDGAAIHFICFLFDAEIMDNIPLAILKYRDNIRSMDSALHLPFVELCLASIKQMEILDQQNFLKEFKRVIEYDNVITSKEFIYFILIKHSLLNQRLIRKKALNNISIRNSVPEVVQILSFLAHLGTANSDKVAANISFKKGLKTITLQRLEIISKKELTVKVINSALNKVRRLGPRYRKIFLEACLTIVLDDNIVVVEEMEIIRAISEILNCPMPPIAVK